MNRSCLFLAPLLLLLLPTLADAQLRLISPNGGESFFVGGTVSIQWSGVAATDTVTLEYSVDRGRTWNLITSRATGLQYQWRPVPNLPSDSALLRVSIPSSTSDSILYFPSEFTTGSRELLIYAEFSSDGTKVLATSGSGHVFIWDSFTKALLLSLQVQPPETPGSFTEPLSPVRFSPDGQFFAAVGPLQGGMIGSFVRIYSTLNGALLREWIRPQSRVDQTVTCAYSPDGTRLLATGQRYGLVYNTADGSQTTLLAGYSDSAGNVTRYGLMEDGAYTSDGSTIIGWDYGADRGVISNAITGDTIRRFNIARTFRPSYVRLSTDDSRIISTGYDYDTTAGRLTQGRTVRTWDAATGAEVLQIDAFGRFARWGDYSSDGSYIAAVGSDAAGQPDLLKVFDPNGAFQRVVGTHQGNMFSVDIGPDNSRILVACNDGARIYQNPTTNPGESDISDAVWSIVRSNSEIITIRLPKVEARQGEFIDVPLTINNPSAALATGATKIEVDLTFNVTLLDPLAPLPRGTIANGFRTIHISAPITSDTTLSLLRFRAALGNDSTTLLNLQNAQADLPALTVVEEDGEFRLLDLCYAGGARLVNPDGLAALRVVSLDRGSEHLAAEFQAPSDGEILLRLADVKGTIVRTFIDELMVAGTYSTQLNLSDLPPGRYFLILKTASGNATEVVEVVR
ncbi:MAG: hypothetical protein AB7H80_15365 [Candidatus Kapaibacterium sp.]